MQKRDGIIDADGLTESEFLARYNPGDWQRPSVTVDIVVFDPDRKASETSADTWIGRILLIKRGGHPCLGMWALPGGFVNPDETLGQAASRELLEETGLDIGCKRMEQVYTLSKPGRDPRTRIISTAHLAMIDGKSGPLKPVAGDDATEAVWFDLEFSEFGVGFRLSLSHADITLTAAIERDDTTGEFVATENTGLAFDHAEMIAYAMERITRIR